jgi:hypothetical protein
VLGFKKGPTPETTGKVDSPQAGEPNAPEVLDLLASLQEMRTEEQDLLETKHGLLVTQQYLQSKLVKEIDKKKRAIDELTLEIFDIQNRCRQLGRVLGVDIYG